ncbi:MAG: response regulator transcription factor [Pseudomonadota bacterium]
MGFFQELGRTLARRLIPRESGPVRLLIADDHAVLREGLKLLLHGTDGFEVVAEASDGEDAVQKAEELKPDIVLLDVAMSNVDGLAAARLITERLPDTKVIILTLHSREEYVFRALKAGASGYLLKDSGISDIMAAIHAVAAGEYYLSPRISRTLIQDYLLREGKRAASECELLSSREQEVLILIVEGASSREIAAKLCLSNKTIENHRANIMRKMQVHNRVALVKAAYRLGLVKADQAGQSYPLPFEVPPLAPK